jgi:anti-anti-sigma factor
VSILTEPDRDEDGSRPGPSIGKGEALAPSRSGVPQRLNLQVVAGTVTATGELDQLSAPRLREALDTAAGNTQPNEMVLLDLTGTTYLDSSGVLELFTYLDRHGLRLRCRAGSAVETVLHIVGIATHPNVTFKPSH